MTRGLGGHSPANVTHFLRGVDFPANKGDLIQQARDNGAEDAVLEVLDAFPDDEFENMADVMKAYGEADQEPPSGRH
jgi:hypothetical protein